MLTNHIIIMYLKVLSCSLLLGLAHGQQRQMTADEFLDSNQKGLFNVIVDVRSQSAFDNGHIEGATLMENLASNGSAEALFGCETCSIAVYCSSGAVAQKALTRLQTEYNFQGKISNSFSLNQWTEAGYAMVTDDSVAPSCSGNQEDTCCTGCEVESEEKIPTYGEEEMSEDGSILRSLGLGFSLVGMVGAVLFS